jgi:hypothetical protein
MSSSEKGIRGVCLVRMGDGTERIVPRVNYMRMKKAGRNVTLLKEGLRWKDLGSWDPALNHPRGPTTRNPYPAIRSLLGGRRTQSGKLDHQSSHKPGIRTIEN